MTWKLKEKYKGEQPINFNIPLDKLSNKQIEGLLESHRELYFEKAGATIKKEKKVFKSKKIEDL
jgi:hypothetical protein